MTTDKPIYAPGTYCRSKTFADGGEIVKLSIHADKFIEFLRDHADEKGWVRLEIIKRREPKDDITHSVRLDTWKPTRRDDPPPKQAPAPTDAKDDLPF